MVKKHTTIKYNFTLKKVNGGFHPVIRCSLNCRMVEALIDTGANITCHGLRTNKSINAKIRIGTTRFEGLIPKYKIPGGYKLLIGSDILKVSNAIIDFGINKITFVRIKK